MSDCRSVLVGAWGLRTGAIDADRRAQDDCRPAHTMSKEPTLAEQEQLADTRRRAAATMARRELCVELCVDAAFLGVVAALFVLPSPQPFHPVAALLTVAVMFLAMRVTFETPFGFTVASQLAFVPMLFCIPTAFVPLVMAAVMFVQMLPAVASGQAPKTRLLRSLANSWVSLGPGLGF